MAFVKTVEDGKATDLRFLCFSGDEKCKNNGP